MNEPHPSDRIAALEWAVHQAMASSDAMVKDVFVPALQACLRDARGHQASQAAQQ